MGSRLLRATASGDYPDRCSFKSDHAGCAESTTKTEKAKQEDSPEQTPPDRVVKITSDTTHINASGVSSDAKSLYPYTATRAYDDETLISIRSLYSRDLEYTYENGRRYSLDYFIPNDDDEQARMSIQHLIFFFLFNKSLTTVPLFNPLHGLESSLLPEASESLPQSSTLTPMARILDIGTGLGDWAIDMAEEYKFCEVIGTDIAPMQPSAVPHNVFFEIFDAEDEGAWTYPENSFDLIHFRNMKGAFHDWDSMYKRTFTHLKPAGWIEVIDFAEQHGFESHFAEDSEIHTWLKALVDAGATYDFAHLTPARLTDAGFEDVTLEEYVIPLGAWSKDDNLNSCSKLWLMACLDGFESISLRPLTRVGWEANEVRRICRRIGREVKEIAADEEKAKGFSISVTVIVGRKPGSGTGPSLTKVR